MQVASHFIRPRTTTTSENQITEEMSEYNNLNMLINIGPSKRHSWMGVLIAEYYNID